MAQKIYKEWFVDFKFRGHETATFKDSELGKIPSDWGIVTANKIIQRLKSENKYTQDNVFNGKLRLNKWIFNVLFFNPVSVLIFIVLLDKIIRSVQLCHYG